MKGILLTVLLVLSCSGSANCQLPQLHPELCGTPNGVVALPVGMSAVIDRDDVIVRFFFKNAATISATAFLDEIAEVCPLSDGRIVVFGAGSGGLRGATSIYVIDEATPALLDNFGGYQPIMSPDQRWIVYRKSYSPHNSEPVTEEYLLYDLSKGPADNRAGGIPLMTALTWVQPSFLWDRKTFPWITIVACRRISCIRRRRNFSGRLTAKPLHLLMNSLVRRPWCL
jgi:hypothetical protein